VLISKTQRPCFDTTVFKLSLVSIVGYYQ